MFGLNPAPALIGAAAIFAAGIAADRLAPIVGANAQIARLKADRDEWRKAAGAWETEANAWRASYRQSEANRKAEQAQAVKAVNDAQASCDARVAAARRSALAIQSIVNREVPTDANGCPSRELLTAGELRDATRPARAR